MVKILLVDDEPDACEILQILISKHIKTPTEIKTCCQRAGTENYC